MKYGTRGGRSYSGRTTTSRHLANVDPIFFVIGLPVRDFELDGRSAELVFFTILAKADKADWIVLDVVQLLVIGIVRTVLPLLLALLSIGTLALANNVAH